VSSFSIQNVFERPLRDRPDSEALVGRFARYSYRELDDAIGRAAAVLARRGVKPGDRVGACLPNQADIVVAFFAAMRLGAIWVGINRPLARPEKEYILNDAEPAVVLVDNDTLTELRDVHPNLIAVDPTDPSGEWAVLMADAGPGDAPHVDVDPFAAAAIAYTGGTTGFPKGVLHSQHNIALVGAIHAALPHHNENTRYGVLLPLTILNMIVLGPVATCHLGACCVAMDRIDPVGVAEWVGAEKVSTFGSVPAVIHDLITHPDVRDEDLASLTRPWVGGADCPDEFRELYRKRFGIAVTTGYGMTEAPTAVTLERPEGPFLPGCAGPALPHVRVTARDGSGNEVAAGEVGEVCVEPATEGPWAGMYRPMLGYWKMPEKTAEALRGGILHTGDLGYLDTDGNLFIKGRRGDLIIRGGANVYPAEVERVLHEDPRVGACAVIGRPDARLGERVVAYVQLTQGESVDPETLRSHCRERLARYKVPEEFVYVDSFVRTPMGKIRKVDLH
jgi:long-chain acyl-CoA synthetase